MVMKKPEFLMKMDKTEKNKPKNEKSRQICQLFQYLAEWRARQESNLKPLDS
jgi:hypothetical protein